MTDEPWPTARLKNLVEPVQTGVWGADPAGDKDDILCVRVADFDRQRFGLKPVETVRSVPEKDRTPRMLRAGDILLEKSGGTDANPVGFTVMFDGGYPAVTSNFIGRVRMRDGQHARFWLYALAASYLTRRTQKCVRQTTGIQNLDQGAFFNEVFAVPALKEQRAIADYLDRETARIDTLIEEQQRLIEMLRERRWAVVERGVALLDWDTPLKAVAPLIQTGPFGSQLKSDEYEDDGIPVINPSHIIAGEMVPDSRVAVSAEKAAELARHRLEEGDLVVARRGDLGRCAVVRPSAAGFLCGTGSALVRLDQTRVDPSFAAMVFSSRRNRDALSLASVGSTMDNLNSDIIGALRVPLPPLDEQRRLTTDLEGSTEKIDTMITETEGFIELARERRSALITAAVTGQIDVREMT